MEITCRTIQGRMLLRPSAGLNDVIRGVLARAARLACLAVHAPVFLSNHYHLLVSVADSQQLAQFMNYLNSNLAREAGRLVRWREKFWGRRFEAVIVSDEEEAQVGRLSYILSQGVKEGLVASPFDWPGVHCAQALTEGTAISGRWHDRTLEFRTRRKGLALDPLAFIEQESLELTPLPCWKSLSPEEYRARVLQLIEAIEADARRQREETGKAPLGADAVCRQHPHHEPNRLKKSPAPLVHAVALAIRRSLRQAYFAFRDAYRYAANRLRAGATDFEFPVGAFPPRLPIRLAARTG